MYKISTLLFLLVSFSSRAQQGCDYPRPNRDDLVKAGVCVLVQPSNKLQKTPQINDNKLMCGLRIVTPILKQILVIDEVDGMPIPGATITLIPLNGNTKSIESSGIDGAIHINPILVKNGYEVIVSSIGYISVSKEIVSSSDRNDTITLARNIIECKPVVVTALSIQRSNCFCCYTATRIIKTDSVEKVVEIKKGFEAKREVVRFFPNPVGRGAEITVETWENPTRYIQITDILGRLVHIQKNELGKSRTLKLQLDPRWPPGTYFLQAIYENGQVSASGKIIIQ